MGRELAIGSGLKRYSKFPGLPVKFCGFGAMELSVTCLGLWGIWSEKTVWVVEYWVQLDINTGSIHLYSLRFARDLGKWMP